MRSAERAAAAAARAEARAEVGRRFRQIGGWAAPIGLGLVYLTVADLRPGLNSLFGLGYLLVLWYVLARTKTLSGQAVAGLFALGLLWSVAVAGVTRVLTDGSLPVVDVGAATAITAVTEQSLVLLPLVVLTVLRPVRVRGFAATDWLLAGLTLGLSFQAVEELARAAGGAMPGSGAALGSESALVNGAELVNGAGLVDGAGLGSGAGSVGAGSVEVGQYGLSPLAGGLSLAGNGDAGFAGRAVLAALVTVAIGLAAAAWRHTGNPGLSAAVRSLWRVIAVLMPVGAWWLAVSAQVGWNASVLSSASGLANATGLTGATGSASASGSAGGGWLGPADPSIPAVLRLGWSVGQHGLLLGPLLLVLFLVALLVDAVRLRNAAERGDDPLPYPFAPTRTADRWAGRLTGWAGTRTAVPVTAAVWVIAAGCAVVAYAVRDLVVVLVAPGRPRPVKSDGRPSSDGQPQSDGEPQLDGQPQPNKKLRTDENLQSDGKLPSDEKLPVDGKPKPGREPNPGRGPDIEREPRWAAIDRARQAGVMVRSIRAEAMALAAGPDTVRARRVIRAIGTFGLVGVLFVVFWLGPHWGSGIGATAAGSIVTANGPFGPGTAPDGTLAPTAWLAGTLSVAGSWWGALALWEYVVLGLGAVSLLLFAASPLDPALLGGRSVWLAARVPLGLRRHERTRSYLAAISPLELVVDGGAAVLSVIPQRLTGRLAGAGAGAGSGPEVRSAVRQFASAPSAFIIERRAAGRLAGIRVPVPVGAGRPRTAELPPIKLADGRLLSALTEDDERLFVAELGELSRDLSLESSRDRSAAAEYRARIYGDDERLVSLRPEKWSGGQNTAYGMLTLTAYFDGTGSSWYVPETLPESIRHQAHRELDRRLIEFATVVYYPANPFRALEITTNHPLVARALEERMTRLAIPGYVLLVN